VTARGNVPLSTRAAPDIHRRVEAAALRAGVAKATWLLEAVVWALEQDEAPTRHTPKAIADAQPHRAPNATLVLPRGRVFGPRF
jgi:hypothetical protein